ncbi:leucine aminopeptidase [Biscogniauxia mediterranea]|nr:leucine aminopeptidase [Biscogniauxia mediterranea]
MRATSSALAISATSLLALTSHAKPVGRAEEKPLVNDDELQSSVTVADLMQCAQDLEDIAYATPGRNRLHGTEGHLNTVKYIEDQLNSLGDYYTIEKQEYTTEIVFSSEASLTIDGAEVDTGAFEFVNNGTWTDKPLVPVANIGCDAGDYPDNVEGNIALISRGTCTFALKAQLAGENGAVGAIIYNNVDAGPATGTLGGVNDLIPVAGITKAEGERLVEEIAGGSTITSSGIFSSYIANGTSYNVIASSKVGDPNNVLMLGAHSDSVVEGPGINDNGSGSCGILTVAKQLAKSVTNNQVRFAWWTAEEEGLLGATHYVETAEATVLDKIRLYLNFDMIASPNFIYGVYDGDGSAYNLSGPAGSAEVEKLFHDWLQENDHFVSESEFNGRSDYGPFLERGIPCGGLDTGADGIKTEEEAANNGGTAGIIYDPNYHTAADNITNLNPGVFETMSRGIAHAVATYGTSWQGFPLRNATSRFGATRRWTPRTYTRAPKFSRKLL